MYLFILYVNVFILTHMPQYAYRGQRTTLGRQFSHHEGPGNQTEVSGLPARLLAL